MRHADLSEDLNRLTGEVVDAALEVHRELGPGLLERIYRDSLARELGLRGFRARTEVGIPVSYKGFPLGTGYRSDVLVERKVLVEVKVVGRLHDVHFAQVSTYLKLGRLPVGLLINFDSVLLKSGIHRVLCPPPRALRPSVPPRERAGQDDQP